MSELPAQDNVAEFDIAQFNVARLLHPLDAAESAEFEAAIDPVNALAEATPGFVWRLRDEDDLPSGDGSTPGEDDPLLIVNLSVWADLDSLRHFVARSGHGMYLRRRREWFEPSDQAMQVCWWVPTGTTPDLAEAWRRLHLLRSDGPSHEAWPLHDPH